MEKYKEFLKLLLRVSLRFSFTFFLTLFIFAYATWGDFSWLILEGPIGFFPDLDAEEEMRFVTTPAVRNCITYFLFILTNFFFLSINNLISKIFSSISYIVGVLSVTFSTFLFFSGGLEGFTYQSTSFRIASLIVAAILLVLLYSPSKKAFILPEILRNYRFYISFFSVLFVLYFIAYIQTGGFQWLSDTSIFFVFLRFILLLFTLLLTLFLCRKF
ncbi:MAG: hypothetical protein IJU76_00970 [Desulfovibrionaceae bacterium]|nr:hypothetical protein [Desulfovibrionaceae bacterium]